MTMNAMGKVSLLHNRLAPMGITWQDAADLRRISMTLSRWGELECGDASGHAIERDEVTNLPYVTYDAGNHGGKRCRYRVADREAGALRRLQAIMARYPGLWAYHQTDPRGCALYVGSLADVTGSELSSNYTCAAAQP